MHQFRDRRRMDARPARLTAGSHVCEVEIRNVSRTGLRLAGAPPDVPPGALVRVSCGPVNLVGQVRWRLEDRAGVKLTHRMQTADARFFGI